jgi:hypothetical protein
VDLIAFETLRRLRAAGIANETIDDTSVLPELSEHVAHYDIQRDLPSFPAEPLKVFGMAIDDEGARTWGPPQVVGPEPDGPEGGRRDMELLFCSKPGCKTFGCSLHGETCPVLALITVRGQYDLTIQAPDAFARYLPKRPEEPCSRSCCVNEDKPAGEWSTPELSNLIVAIGSKYRLSCDLRLAFPGRTCSEVSEETIHADDPDRADLRPDTFADNGSRYDQSDMPAFSAQLARQNSSKTCKMSMSTRLFKARRLL